MTICGLQFLSQTIPDSIQRKKLCVELEMPIIGLHTLHIVWNHHKYSSGGSFIQSSLSGISHWNPSQLLWEGLVGDSLSSETLSKLL